MIITQVIGGLGNQMFQYAAGRALSLQNDTTLSLDISAFESYGLHQGFELHRLFNSSTEIASQQDIRRVLGWQSSSSVRRIISRKFFRSLTGNNYVAEPHFHYWSGIQSVAKECYLSGYWQSEKYFTDVEAKIRTDFTFMLPMDNQNAELAQQISLVNAVSLHVRRGDYVNDSKTNSTHGVCSLEYYRSAILEISKNIKDPHFFVFSDDIAWVQNNLKINYPCIYVEHNRNKESYNDMRLMSLCQHHIIANSSFSWWGAWLNSSPEKIVIAPKAWFANETIVKDLLPQGWVTL